MVGLVLAIAGAALVARRADDAEEEARYPNPRASVIWAIASAVAFGVFLTAIPPAAESGRAWALLDARIVLVVLVAVWAGQAPGAGALSAAAPPRSRSRGCCSSPARCSTPSPLDHGQLSIVSVLGALFPLFTVGLSVALLDDRLSREQAFGVVAAFAGIALIAASS